MTESFSSILSDRQRKLFLSQWHSGAKALMERDGTDTRFENGGHRIKQDPLLIAAIEEIRDQYFSLFTEKAGLQKELEHNNDTVTRQKIEDIDYDLILLNKESFERLQAPNYGLSAEKVSTVSQPDSTNATTTIGLKKGDAAKILGSVIKQTINAFEIAFSRDRIERPLVPHLPLSATPEKTGRHRHFPRTSWVESTSSPHNSSAQITS